MPPKRNAQTDEQKEEAFKQWQDSADFKAISELQNAINKDPEIAKIEQSTEDIWQDWTDVCNKWYKLMEVLKAPKKSKGKYNLEIKT